MSSGLGQRHTLEDFDLLEDSNDIPETVIGADGIKPAFCIPMQFGEVTSISMNRQMVELLFNVIQEIDGGVEKELWAMARALKDPEGCRRRRQENAQNRQRFVPR